MNGTPGRAKGGGGVSATLAAAADDDAPGTRQALRTWHGAAVEHRAAAAAAAATRERATLSSRIHELQSALFRADANERSRTAYGYLQGLQLQHAHEETARLRRSLAATHGERTVQRTEILHLAARLTLERSARHAAFADELDSLALRCPPPAGEKRHALADELQRLAAKLGVANGATVGAAAGGDAAARAVARAVATAAVGGIAAGSPMTPLGHRRRATRSATARCAWASLRCVAGSKHRRRELR